MVSNADVQSRCAADAGLLEEVGVVLVHRDTSEYWDCTGNEGDFCSASVNAFEAVPV